MAFHTDYIFKHILSNFLPNLIDFMHFSQFSISLTFETAGGQYNVYVTIKYIFPQAKTKNSPVSIYFNHGPTFKGLPITNSSITQISYTNISNFSWYCQVRMTHHLPKRLEIHIRNPSM
jgi:hypothetical protein